MINLLCKFWKSLMYFSQGILEEHAKGVFMGNAFMSRFCSCAICLFSLTNWAEFFTISVSLNCFHKDKQTLRRKKINSQMFSDTCTDQLVVFNYSQFNIQCSAAIFTAQTLVKIETDFYRFCFQCEWPDAQFQCLTSSSA